MCCRENVNPVDPNNKAGFWGTNAKCDLPLNTVKYLTQQAVAKEPEFIIYNGDNPGHDVWNVNNEQIAANNLKIMIDTIKEAGYKGPIIIALGNHEVHPVNVLNFNNKEKAAQFFGLFLEPIKELLSEEAQKTFLKGGYYSLQHKGIRFIVNNCNLCSTENYFVMMNKKDPLEMFSWMEKELREAETVGENVYLVGHTPFGNKGMLNNCNMRYKVLVDRFTNIIRGQFYGHTHKDRFMLNQSYETGKVTGSLWTIGALTTYTFKDPMFREWEAFEDNKGIKTYKEFSYKVDGLTEAEKPQESVFTDFFQVLC